jgi:hypothetical protein
MNEREKLADGGVRGATTCRRLSTPRRQSYQGTWEDGEVSQAAVFCEEGLHRMVFATGAHHGQGVHPSSLASRAVTTDTRRACVG